MAYAAGSLIERIFANSLFLHAGLSINKSRDLQPEVLNKVVRKQALSSTVLITVWRLELSHVIAVMSLLSSYSYPNPKHVTFIFRIS